MVGRTVARGAYSRGHGREKGSEGGWAARGGTRLPPCGEVEGAAFPRVRLEAIRAHPRVDARGGGRVEERPNLGAFEAVVVPEPLPRVCGPAAGPARIRLVIPRRAHRLAAPIAYGYQGR